MRKLSAFAGKLHGTIIICALAALAGTASATNYYIATYGSDSNSGTSTNANQAWATLAHAVTTMSAGDTVYMRGGSYATSSQIDMKKMGTSGSGYTITNYPGEVPILDYTTEPRGSSEGIRITGAYWQLYGLVITNAAHNGLNIRGNGSLTGSFNWIERCVFVGCSNSGFLVGSSSSPGSYLPSSNTIINCDAIRNYDAGPTAYGGNADGFSAKWYIGPGNKFIGCRAWQNSDDGWDLWMGQSPVLISNCWAWQNGSNVWNSGTFEGNGNGFKLGGNNVAANHTLVYSLAYQNINNGSGGNGIDQNDNTGSLTVDQNTSWGNKGLDFNLNHSPNKTEHHTVRNNLVIGGGASRVSITANSTVQSNSWQVISPDPNSNDVLSMDASQLAAPRQADGSLPVITLVHPVSGGRLVDKGIIIPSYPYNGSAPDLGAFETTGGTLPVAAFTGSPASGTAPLAVTFTDTSTGTVPLSLFWDFGDATATNTAGGASFGHTFAAGTYTITLTASNSVGVSTLVSNNLVQVITAFQAWQQQYFNCTNCPQADAAADPDGDGQNNQAEFLSGTNPTNSLSGLRIISAAADNNDAVITWRTAGGRTNAVQATGGDTNGDYTTNFADISGLIIIPGSGDATTNFVDTGGATNRPDRYYRIRLVP